MVDAPYVLRATPARVELWTCSRIPFEAGVKRPWKKELVGELRAATASLEPNGQVLAGTYATTRPIVCDTENTLFTNPGTAAFPANPGAIRWELDPNDPPRPPQPLADLGEGLHYYRYERGQGFRVWEPDLPLAHWHRVPRQLADDGSGRPMWLALREALVRGDVSIHEWNVPEDTRYGLRIEIHAPLLGPRSAVAASEPLVDGALSALHAGAPLSEAAPVAQVLASKLGATAERILELVGDRMALFPASPFVLNHGYLQLSPCDHMCVAGEVRITRDPTVATVETSGEIFSVIPKDASDAGNAPGAGLLGYLDTHMAKDITLAEAAIEWTESLPPDHLIDSDDVIRTSRSDGSYVAAYEVPGPEIGMLHQELDPSRLLAEVSAKKAIIELHSETAEGNCAACAKAGHDGQLASVRFPCRTLLALALPYARLHDVEEMRRLYGW